MWWLGCLLFLLCDVYLLRDVSFCCWIIDGRFIERMVLMVVSIDLE